MSLFDRLFSGGPRLPAPVEAPRQRVEPSFHATSPENPSTNLANPADWLVDWATGGMPQRWGPIITEQTAMAVSAVYRCVSIISGMACSLPIKFYERTPDGPQEIPDHPMLPFFHTQPQPENPMSAYIWKEAWLTNLLLWGNHFSIINRNGAGATTGFEAVLPWNCTVLRNGKKNVYRCVLWGNMTGFVETSTQETVVYVNQEDMLHIPGQGFNNITGMSRIRSFARNAASLAQVLEDQEGYTHENSSNPSAFVTPGKKQSPEGFKRFKSQFDQRNTGRPNAGRVIYGDEGATYTAMQMRPIDLNSIEARRYQVADISRFFGVPLHLLNEVEKSTAWGSGLAEQTLAFKIWTLEPIFGRIEAELNMKLDLGPGVFCRFDREELLAMNPQMAAEVARTEIASGTLLINEWRKKKHRPPVEHGDKPLINSTNVRLDALYLPGAQPRVDPIQADPVPPKADVGTSQTDQQTDDEDFKPNPT